MLEKRAASRNNLSCSNSTAVRIFALSKSTERKPVFPRDGRNKMCNVLNETAVDGNSKTSEWLMNTKFFTAEPTTKRVRLPDPEKDTHSKRFVYGEGELIGKISKSIGHRRRRGGLSKKTGSDLSRAERFKRTTRALRQSGLLQVTASICQLARDSELIQKEIDGLQEEIVKNSARLKQQLENKLTDESAANGSCSQEGMTIEKSFPSFPLNQFFHHF